MGEPRRSRPAVRAVWAQRDMRLVIPARAIGFMGDSVTFSALSLRLAGGNDPAVFVAVLAAFGLPPVLLAGVAGRLIDREDSRRLLVLGGGVQVVASAGLIWAPDLIWIIGCVLALQCGQTVTGPTWSALVPRIVGDDLMGVAIGLQASLAGAASMVGIALGGVLFDRVGYGWAIAIDTVTFALLVVAALAVRSRRAPDPTARSGAIGHAGGRPAARRRAEGGLAALRRDAVLRVLVPALFMFVLAADGTNVVETLLVTQVLGGNGTVYGLLGVFFATGAVIGPLLAARLESDRARVLAVAVFSAGVGLCLALMGVLPGVWWLAPPLVVVGVAGGGLNALCLTLVTTRTPDAFRGRVLATVTGGARAAALLALVIGGLLGQALGPRHAYVVLGVLTLAAAPMALLGLRGLREPRDR